MKRASSGQAPAFHVPSPLCPLTPESTDFIDLSTYLSIYLHFNKF